MNTQRFFEPLPWSIPIRVRQLLSRDDLQLAASRHSWGSKRVGFGLSLVSATAVHRTGALASPPAGCGLSLTVLNATRSEDAEQEQQ